MIMITRRTLLTWSSAFAVAISSATGALAASPSSAENAWTIIASEPKFSDMVALIKYAGLTQYVETDRFTAFIPTNAAFDKNPEVMPALMVGHSKAFPDTTRVVEFIRSHAIYDLHPLSEFSGRSQTLTAISGNPINVDGSQPGSYVVSWTSVDSKIGTARVVDAPITAVNALIYPVDTVVLMDPPSQ